VSDWVEAQRIVIGYLFTDGTAVDLRKAKTILHPEFFTEKRAVLWSLFTKYEEKHSEVLPLGVLRDIARLNRWTEEKLLDFEQEVVSCEEASEGKNQGEFSYYTEKLADLYKEVTFDELMTEGVQKNHKEGFYPARDLVLKGLSGLEKTSINYEAEVELKDETEAFIASMREAKLARSQAVFFGLPAFDNVVMGLREGDLCLFAGFTGVGKTALCVNTAVDACFKQNKNVVYVTTETTVKPLTRRIYSRISKLDLFADPVKLSHMKGGGLSSEENDTLLQINKYIKEGTHGRFVLVQAPPGANLAWLRGRLIQYEGSFKIELVILDDLRNMRASVERRSEWEEFNDLLKGSKNLARTHAGRGVPFISPYQISREGQKNLGGDSKRYKLTDLSSSSEAERTPDLVISLISQEGDNTLLLHIMKQRDGETGREFELEVEFEHQYFSEREGVTDL